MSNGPSMSLATHPAKGATPMNDGIREIAPELPNAVEALEGVVTAGQPKREHLE